MKTRAFKHKNSRISTQSLTKYDLDAHEWEKHSMCICGLEEQFLVEPIAVWDRRVVKPSNLHMAQWLVPWSHAHPSDATWEEGTRVFMKACALVKMVAFCSVVEIVLKWDGMVFV